MRNSFLLLCLLGLTAAAAALRNHYLPGTIAPTTAWFPLRNADFSIAGKIADSLLGAYLRDGRVSKNTEANRLEGKTLVPSALGEGLCGNRAGETGIVFAHGKNLGTATLAAFHLNWCDFYGALIEAQYVPQSRFGVSALTHALWVTGPTALKTRNFPLLPADVKTTGQVKSFLLKQDPPPFDFISDIELTVYAYSGISECFLAVANFSAGSGFSPGVIYLLKRVKDKFVVLGNYFVGEKAEIVQAVLEEGDINPVIEAGTFGSGSELLTIHFDGREFQEVYKRKTGDFP